ncbi:hypothetical protein [Streptomyces sp. NPDC058614]|uniref:hypothetical protein n=1 Tax=Streptomyces sp. NPDC058614 TaxID=3346557 RepID=UPI003650A23F
MARPRVHVHATDLNGESPVALRDGLTHLDLAIDFSWPPEQIVAGLQEVFTDGVESGRWSRNDMREHSEAPAEKTEVAPHPESDLD